MKASEFRKLIREEVRKALKEGQVYPINIATIDNLSQLSSVLKSFNGAFSNLKKVSNDYFKKYAAQFDLDKFKAALSTNKNAQVGDFRNDGASVFIDGVLSFRLGNLDKNTLSTLKQINKPAKQNKKSADSYVEELVDLASSGSGSASGLQTEKDSLSDIIERIKADNLMSAVDKAIVKYINDTEEGAFTMDDLEALQAVGFKMRGVNYDNLEY